MNKHLPYFVATLIVIPACAKSDSSAEAARAESATATVTERTASPASGDDDLREISRYTLRMAKMEKYFQAIRNVRLAIKDVPEDQRDSFNAAGSSLDDYAASLEKNATVRKAIEKAGLSPREFAVIMMASLQAGMAQAIIAMRPNDNADSLAREMQTNAANIRFMRDHKAELEAKQKAMEAETKAIQP